MTMYVTPTLRLLSLAVAAPAGLATESAAAGPHPSGYLLVIGILMALFIASAVYVGRGDGLRCLSALAWTVAICAAASWICAADVAHPLPVFGLGAAACLSGVILLLLGVSRRALAAMLGAGGALLVSCSVCALFLWRLDLTGVFSPTTRDLWYGSGTRHIELHWVALGGMFLAGVGIIADLAVAVTSTIAEVKAVKPEASRRDLFASAMRLGGDVTGTEVNTLIFAFIGVNLGAVLLPLARPEVANAPVPWMEVLNRQSIAVEAVAALAGTLGLALAIPLTAAVGSALLAKEKGDAAT